MSTRTKTTKTKAELAEGDEKACDLIERKHLTCPTCNKKAIRLNEDGSWGCPWGTDHSRVIQSETLRGYIDQLVKYDGTPDKTIKPRKKKNKKIGQWIEPDPDEEPVIIPGREVQLDRLMHALDFRCGWVQPRWMNYFRHFEQLRKQRDKPCVLRVGKWFVSFGGREEGAAIEVRRLMRWKSKVNETLRTVVRITYSPFDHNGSIEAKIVAAGIVILN